MKTQYPGEAIKIVSMSRTKQTVVCMAGSLSLNMTGNLEKLLPIFIMIYLYIYTSSDKEIGPNVSLSIHHFQQ